MLRIEYTKNVRFARKPFNIVSDTSCVLSNDIIVSVVKDRQWTCPKCGSHHDRDINAVINILRAAYDLRCGTDVRPFFKKANCYEAQAPTFRLWVL